MSFAPLAGCRVWLGRPAGQAGPWTRALTEAGARVVHEPLIDIAGPADEADARDGLHRAATADVVIATSANAVSAIGRLVPDWQPQGRLIAVGGTTGQALAAHTGRAVEQPEQGDSEGLLAMAALAEPAGRRIAVLAGEGGRALLADTLAAQGARVEKIALYRRVPAVLSSTRLDALLSEQQILVVTSEAAWQALIDQCNERHRTRLAALSLVAASTRVIQRSQQTIDWRHTPVVIRTMSPGGARVAVSRAWHECF